MIESNVLPFPDRTKTGPDETPQSEDRLAKLKAAAEAMRSVEAELRALRSKLQNQTS